MVNGIEQTGRAHVDEAWRPCRGLIARQLFHGVTAGRLSFEDRRSVLGSTDMARRRSAPPSMTGSRGAGSMPRPRTGSTTRPSRRHLLLAVVDGGEATVYAIHLARPCPRHSGGPAAEGAVIRYVVLSWHVDHVAGNAAFTDCPIVASACTARLPRRIGASWGGRPADPVAGPAHARDLR